MDQRTEFLGRQDQKITEARVRRLEPRWAQVTIHSDPAIRETLWTGPGERSTRAGMTQD